MFNVIFPSFLVTQCYLPRCFLTRILYFCTIYSPNVFKCKLVPLRSLEAYLGERRYSSYSFLTSALEGGEWSASRPGRDLPPGKEPPVPTVQEAGWAPELVWTQRLEEKSSASVGERTPAVQSVVRHCTDWAAPAHSECLCRWWYITAFFVLDLYIVCLPSPSGTEEHTDSFLSARSVGLRTMPKEEPSFGKLCCWRLLKRSTEDRLSPKQIKQLYHTEWYTSVLRRN
jgi:hypothetical protein